MALKVLFIGGTGQISYPCVDRAVAEGHHVSVFNRGLRSDPLPAGVTVAADPETGDVHLVAGPHFRGIQFHAESILTEHGYDLIHDLVCDLLRPVGR